MQQSLLGYITRLNTVVENRIRNFIDEYRPKWIYVFFSAGKDSSAVLAAAAACCKDRTVAVFNHIVGQTHSLNVTAALTVARRLGFAIRRLAPRSPDELKLMLTREPPQPGEMIYILARSYRFGLDYWTAVSRWGFPAPAERWGRGVRWCCSEFKEKWWHVLPANGVYHGKPAKYLVVGIKRSDSSYRRRKWSGTMVKVFMSSPIDVALAPLADLTDNDVWMLLKHYGIYDIVHRQYEIMGHSPNCVLCPLMGKRALQRTVEQLPTTYLKRVLGVLAEVRGRYGGSTFSGRRIDEWVRVIRGELERRGETVD